MNECQRMIDDGAKLDARLREGINTDAQAERILALEMEVERLREVLAHVVYVYKDDSDTLQTHWFKAANQALSSSLPTSGILRVVKAAVRLHKAQRSWDRRMATEEFNAATYALPAETVKMLMGEGI